MATGADVLRFLRPDGGWVIIGDDFGTVRLDDGVEPITKAEFEAGFAQYDAWKAEQEAIKAADKAAILNRLGITAEEAQALLG